LEHRCSHCHGRGYTVQQLDNPLFGTLTAIPHCPACNGREATIHDEQPDWLTHPTVMRALRPGISASLTSPEMSASATWRECGNAP
jgi:hypothetical protein